LANGDLLFLKTLAQTKELHSCKWGKLKLLIALNRGEAAASALRKLRFFARSYMERQKYMLSR
jgi:hypothetical protein